MQTKIRILIFSILCLTFMPQPVNAQTASEETRRHVGQGEAARPLLTAPEVIDVLVSLSDGLKWQKTGNCGTYLIEFKDAYSKRDGQVSVKTGFFLFGDPDQIYKSKHIEGPEFEYSFFANTCPPGPHQRDYDCFGEALITVEVVSRELVRIRQKPLRRDPNNYIPAGERSCTFQKK